jgi:hypothetical protein
VYNVHVTDEAFKTASAFWIVPAFTCTVTVLLTVNPAKVTTKLEPTTVADAVALVATIIDWFAIVQALCEVIGKVKVVNDAESTYVPLALAWLTTGAESTTLKVHVT